jgi:hypothetical protein
MARRSPLRLLTETQESSDFSFNVASRADEPEVRRLLRDNPLGGRFAISLEREPDAFASDFGIAQSHIFVIARSRGTGQAVGLCERIVRPAYFGGRARPLAYLGGLRVDPRYRNRISMLRGGFAAVQRFADASVAWPFALTSITSDNLVARRVLTAGVRGLPRYQAVGEFSTFALRARRRRAIPEISRASDADIPDIAAFLQEINAQFSFGAVWTEAEFVALRSRGLRSQDILIARRGGALIGCLAVWDQRGIKQAVVRAYPRGIAQLRPLINLAAPLLGSATLPKVGRPINHAYLSHLAVREDRAEVFLDLLRAGLDQAHRRGFDVATIGMAPSRGLSALVRRFRPIEYRTTLYLVGSGAASAPDSALIAAPPHPELAMM